MSSYHMLRELLLGPLARRVTVVGVGTDDPSQPFTHALGEACRLFKNSRENSLAEVEIRAIDFVTAMTMCAPFLIAIRTVEQEPRPD